MKTTKLKRKLVDLGVDITSKKATENFCLIGTPLPPLEKFKDAGEYVPIWKQEVRDEKGRRRLHGAFTGGFSAGYFNTVGSKEGWAPSTFVSSRNERSSGRVSKPEDFMDEEDLAELRAGQKLVSEHDEMDLSEGMGTEAERSAALEEREKDPITHALEQAMAPSQKDSAGARILKKMGWKVGWGIGPRVSWRRHEIQYGRDPDATDADEEAKKHTYPPRDTGIIVVERKDNFHGLGYNSAPSLHTSLGVKISSSVEESLKLAGGFGLGVMNDADEDDLEIYDHATSRGKSRTAFDVNDVHDEDHVATKKQISASYTSQASVQTPQSRQRQTASLSSFQDGTPVLQEFVLAEKPVIQDVWFPLPDVPEGWTPNPQRVWKQAEATNADDKAAIVSVPSRSQTHTQKKMNFTPDQRGAALGETPLPSEPRSVFEYISKKDQERIKSAVAGRFTTTTTPDTKAADEATPPDPSDISTSFIEPHIAEAALRGFQPFSSNSVKQARYSAYLRAHAEPGSGESIPPRMSDQSLKAYALEMHEYAKAATLFRPVTGAIAGRFTSAAVLDLGPQVVEGLHKPIIMSTAQGDPSAETTKEEAVKEEDPKVHAARLGMYGPMTREVKPWQPARLLCKRFGVKDPNPDIHFDTPGPSSNSHTDHPVNQGSGVPGDATATASTSQGEQKSSSGKRDLQNIGFGEDDGQGDDILTYQRPAMDIFKAIFASDEEDSEEEGGVEVPDEATAAAPIHPQTSDPPPPSLSVASEPTKDEVDLSAFKPTFIPRDPQAKAKDKKNSTKVKKDKKSKGSKSGVLVSFDLDEEGGGSSVWAASQHKDKERDRDRPRKKRKKQGEDKAEMWVEKPLPEVVRGLPADLPLDTATENTGVDFGPARGRKRAVDFM